MDKLNLENNFNAKCLEMNDILDFEAEENNPPSTCATPNFAPMSGAGNYSPIIIQPVPIRAAVQHPVYIPPGYYQNVNVNDLYQGNYLGQRELVLEQYSNNVVNSNFLHQRSEYACVPNYTPTPLCNSSIYNRNIQSANFQAKPPLIYDKYSKNLATNQKRYLKHGYDNNRHKSCKKEVVDLSNIEPSIEKLGLRPNNDIDLFSAVFQFRRLSYFIQLLCEERHTFETLLLTKSLSCSGYKPNTNYLPVIITDLSNYISLIKQAISHELTQFEKLFESFPNNYKEFNELSMQLKCEFVKLEEFEVTRIRHKNGTLLLSNDKLNTLFSSTTNLIEIIREFSMNVKVLQFKLKEMRDKQIEESSMNNIKLSPSKRNRGY